MFSLEQNGLQRVKLLQDYLKLIQDTRLFIQREYSLEEKNVPIPPPALAPAPIPAPALPPSPPPTKSEKPPQAPPTKGGWALQPMSQTEETSHFRDNLSSFAKTCAFDISTFLVLPEENGAHRLFLENVSRAITKTFQPSTVVLFQEKLLQMPGKIFLIPLSCLKSQFPNLEPHQFIKTPNTTFLALENLDNYAEDVNCKRALWNAIQLLFR